MAYLDPRLRQQCEVENRDWTQNECLFIYDQLHIIEPRYDWAVSAKNKLIVVLLKSWTEKAG